LAPLLLSRRREDEGLEEGGCRPRWRERRGARWSSAAGGTGGRRWARARTRCGEEGHHGTHAATARKKRRGGPCTRSGGYLLGEAAGAPCRAHLSTPPPTLWADSTMRRRATSPDANGTAVPERPVDTLHRSPLASCEMPPACASRWLATSRHTTFDPCWSMARSRPQPRRRCHPLRNHHRTTPPPPRLWLRHPIEPPELCVDATTWWERTDGRPPGRPSLLYAPAAASSVQRGSATLWASPTMPLERCLRVDVVRPHLHRVR
jgi:hypothetical protein